MLSVRRGIVVGSGRLGSSITTRLFDAGWNVTVIDRNPEALPNRVEIQQLVGDPINLEALDNASADEADTLVVAAANDEWNVVVAALGRTVYGVPCAMARVRDVILSGVTGRLGIDALCPDMATATAVVARMEQMARLAQLSVAVVGCGSLGARVASLLSLGGHRVVVVDDSEAAFRNLPPGFTGNRVTVERMATLLSTESVRGTNAIVTTTLDETENVMLALAAARDHGAIALACVADPQHHRRYRSMGIETVSVVDATADEGLMRIERCSSVRRKGS